jgi:anti-anti-sigma factor
MEDFERKIIKDIIVEVVNLTRATYKEAGELKKILSDYHDLSFRKVIVDISQCEFIDSTFLGVLVVALKNMSKIGSELRLVKPSSDALALMETVGTLKIFNSYETLEQAVNSFDTT